jgi:Gpi18-like mannosyltransferase
LLISKKIPKELPKESPLGAVVFVTTVFFISRIFVIAGVFLGRKFVHFPVDAANKIIPVNWWESLLRWDAGSYLEIAARGYAHGQFQDGLPLFISLFPLYPLTIRLISALSGLQPAITGLLISNIFFWAALLLLYFYVKNTHTDSDPRLAIKLMAFFPFSFFCSSAYAESLFILLSIFSLMMFRKKHMIASALGLSLLGATRLAGLFVLAAMSIYYLFEKLRFMKGRPLPIKGKALLAITGWNLLAVSGFLAFTLYQYMAFGHWDAFILTQKSYHRHEIGSFMLLFSETNTDPFNIMNILPTVITLAVSFFFLFSKQYRIYSLWGILSVLVPLSTGTFLSMTRYTMVFFPTVIFLSRLLKDTPALRELSLLTFSSTLVMLVSLFVQYYFIG